MPNRNALSIPLFILFWFFALIVYVSLRIWMQSNYGVTIYSPSFLVVLAVAFSSGFVVLDPPILNKGAGRRLAGIYTAWLVLLTGGFLLWEPYGGKDSYLISGLLLLFAGAIWLNGDVLSADESKQISIKPAHEKWAFGGIVALGILVRLWHLGTTPGNWWFDEINLSRAIIEHVLDPGKAPIYVAAEVENPGAYLCVGAVVFKVFGTGVDRLRYLAAFYGVLTLFPFYFLARRMLGVFPGLVALALFCAMRWTLIPQRIAFMSGFGLFWTLCAVYFYCRCLTSKKLMDFAAFGISLAMTLHAYTPARLVAPFLLVVSLFEFKRIKEIPLRAWLVFALTYLAVSTPMLHFMMTNWKTFAFRSNQVSIANDIHAKGWGQLWVSFKAHLLMFNFQGDHQSRHNLQDWPQLDYLSACLFVPGLLFIHATAWKDSRARILTFWFWIMLSAGIFSIVSEAPQANRSILVVPVTALASAFFLSRCVSSWAHCFKKGISGGFKAAGLILLLVVPAFNFEELSVIWANRESTWIDFSPQASMVAKRALAERKDYKVYASILEREYPFYGRERFAFLYFFLGSGRNGARVLRSNPNRITDEGQKGILLIWAESDETITQKLKEEFPDLTVEAPTGPFGIKPVYFAAEIPIEKIPHVKTSPRAKLPLIYWDPI